MRHALITAVIVAVCASVFLYIYKAEVANAPHPQDLSDQSIVQESQNEETVPTVMQYGQVTLKVGQWAVFPDIRIRPLLVSEDSRCPSDVDCVQAGTVRVELETVSGMGTSTDTLSLDSFLTTEAEMVTFMDAKPMASSQKEIPQNEYQLVFMVEKRSMQIIPLPDPRPVNVGPCYVGGCSSQLCTDTPDMASTCEYREEYACYAHATCERQSNGQCGWTPTPSFNSCMQNASQSVYPQ